MIGWAAAGKLALGFGSKHLDKIIGVALIAAATALIWGVGYRAGSNAKEVTLNRAFTVEREQWQKERTQWQEERDKATNLAAAEARRRKQFELEAQEHEQRVLMAAAEREAKLVAERDASNRARSVLDAAVTNYAKAGFVSAPTADSVRDLAIRAQTLGLLVTERNRMAAEAEREADQCGSAYQTCRGHAEVIEAMRQRIVREENQP